MQRKSQGKFCFVTLPFGKLLHIINPISDLVPMKRHNWSVNWLDACNNTDYNSVLALIMLLNEWRETQIFYKVPKSKLKFHGKSNYSYHIFNVLPLLSKTSNNVNHKVELIIVEILSFYYSKFDSMDAFVEFGHILDDIIDSLSRFLLFYSAAKNKNDNKELLEYPDMPFIMRRLGNLADFLGNYDDVGPKVQTINVDPSPQSTKHSKDTIGHIVETKCFTQLLSTFAYIKTDLLCFIDLHFQKQLEKYNEKSQPIRDKRIAQNKRKMNQQQENNLDIFETRNFNNVKKIQFQGAITPPLLSIRKIITKITKTGDTANTYFAYISPLMRYLPRLLINSISENQQQIIIKNILIPTMKQLSRIFDNQSKNSFKDNKKASQFSQMELVRFFRDTSFIDDLEITLVAHFECDIEQYKSIEGYEEQYKEVQSYFVLVSKFRKNITKALQSLMADFQRQQKDKLHPLQELLNSQGIRKQAQNKNSQQKPIQQSNKTITINQKKQKNTDTPVVNPERKKPGPKPQDKRKTINRGDLHKITEASNQEDEATDTGEQIKYNPFKKMQQKKQKKGRKSRKSIDYNESDDSEEEPQSLSIKPLHKKNQSVSPMFKQSREASSKNTLQSSRNHPQRPNKSQEHKSAGPDTKNSFSIIRPLEFLTYYQHQGNSYNARKIFREERTEYRFPDMNTPFWSYEHFVYRYPEFINTEAFVNSPVQTFAVDYEKLKYVKSVLYPQQIKHKYFLRYIYDQNMRIIRLNIDYQDNLANNKKPASQLKADKDNIQKMKKQLALKKAQNLDHYLNYTRRLSKISQVSIKLYPFIKTVYGYKSIEELTRLSQIFLFHLVKRQLHVQQLETNYFNQRQRHINEMISLKIDRFTSKKTHQLLMSIFFEIMDAIKSSETALTFFYHSYFSTLPPYLQSQVIFYMFEIQPEEPIQQEILFRNFFINLLTGTDLANLLTFMIKDAKLNSLQLKKMYQQIHGFLNERCYMMIRQIEILLCQEIIPLVKYEKCGQESKEWKKNRHQILQELKQRFSESLSTMLDLMNLWLCLNYSSTTYEPKLPGENPFPQRSVQLMYFCYKCGGPQAVQFTTKKLANYQNIICEFCNNSMINRFELSCFKLYWLHKEFTLDMKATLKASFKAITKTVKEHTWKFDIPQLFEYKEDKEARNNRFMELDEDDSRGNGGDRHQNHQGRKQKKTEEEHIQEDNEEFCYNSCQILLCYYNGLSKLMRKMWTQ